ncbi:MAG: lysophospholipid acyltransferase family protein [Pseudomonadota bacterium]
MLMPLRSFAFLLVMAVTLAVFVPVLLLTVVLPVPARFRFANTWIRFNLGALRLLCGLTYEVRGREKIPDEPVIYFAKHQSTLETFLLQVTLPPFSWVLKKQALHIPLFGWGLAILNPISIDRSAGRSAVEQVRDQGRERLEQGYSVIIFPEGTRKAPGSPPHYRIGGGVLAEGLNVPLVPVALNTGYFWPPKSLFVRRSGKAVMEFGDPFHPAGMNARDIVNEMEARIEAASNRLLAEAGGEMIS